MIKKSFLLIVVLQLLLVSCGGDVPVPKPEAYLRIDLPAQDYEVCDTNILPFKFDYSTQSLITLKKNTRSEKWVDIYYPILKGVVFLSYKPIHGEASLKAQIDTSYQFLSSHFNYSSGVKENQYVDKDNKVYATTYRLEGHNVASTYQFWATDSTKHFLRGALFMNSAPNNDSLSPILNYIQEDLVHLLESLRWRD